MNRINLLALRFSAKESQRSIRPCLAQYLNEVSQYRVEVRRSNFVSLWMSTASWRNFLDSRERRIARGRERWNLHDGVSRGCKNFSFRRRRSSGVLEMNFAANIESLDIRRGSKARCAAAWTSHASREIREFSLRLPNATAFLYFYLPRGRRSRTLKNLFISVISFGPEWTSRKSRSHGTISLF